MDNNNKVTINLETVEDGDFETISMITKVLEDYFYNFVSFDQKLKISKEEDRYFCLCLLNRKSGEPEGIIILNQGDGLERPWLSWDDDQTGFSSKIQFDKSKDFRLEFKEKFLELLRKFNEYKDLID